MFTPNSVIAGRYQVIRLVGQGGMSNLYLAHDRKYSNATVVIKEMTASYADPKEQKMAVELFHREAKLLASLNHRHIPKVYDYFQFAGKYYLSMEYIDGVDLAVKLEEAKGPLPEEQVLDWGQQMATVLFYLHKHDPPIVFRDVKPSNIMISSQGVKLIDFGIARHFDQAKKGDTMRIGSPGYAPPEQYTAQTDPRSDIYALGVTLHHALTGRDPTATSTPFLVPPARDLNPQLSESTESLLKRATQLDPDDRYQDALEFKRDIKKILKRDKQSTRVVSSPPKLPSSAQAPAPTATTTGASSGSGSGQSAGLSAPAAGPTQSPPQSSANQPVVAQAQATNQAPAQGTAAPSSPSNGSQKLTPTPAGKPKKKKSPSLAKLLLVSGLFLGLGGGGYLASLESSERIELTQSVQSHASYWWERINKQKNSEEILRESLLKGDADALITAFESEHFQGLPPAQKELFEANRLAARSTRGGIRIVNILVQEEGNLPQLWESAALAVRLVNAKGGIDRELLTVFPIPYQRGQLESKLLELTQSQHEEESQHFLILDAEGEKTPDIPGHIFEIQDSQKELGKDLSSLFLNELENASKPLAWGIPGTVPEFCINTEQSPLPELDAQGLEKLDTLARESGGRIVLEAKQMPADTGDPTGLLLLALDRSELPTLPPGTQAEALVLNSPFSEPGTTHAFRLSPPQSYQLSTSKARLVDYIVMTALGDKGAFEGLSIRRGSTGKHLPKRPTKCIWDKDVWSPQKDLGAENDVL